MLYVLAFPAFSKTTTEWLTQFRQKHEPNRAKIVPPHVTLVFGCQTVSEKKLTALCRQAAEKRTALQVSFEEREAVHDPFEGAHKLLLLCGDGAGQLSELHKELYAGPHAAERHPDHPFRPHMTVATNANPGTIDTLAVRSDALLPLIGEIAALEVVHFANGQLSHLTKIPFAVS